MQVELFGTTVAFAAIVGVIVEYLKKIFHFRGIATRGVALVVGVAVAFIIYFLQVLTVQAGGDITVTPLPTLIFQGLLAVFAAGGATDLLKKVKSPEKPKKITTKRIKKD